MGLARFRAFTVEHLETDLWIGVDSSSYQHQMELFAIERVKKLRSELDLYIRKNPVFQDALSPIKIPDNVPAIAKEMAYAAGKAEVGPMASVAGAFSEMIGRDIVDKFGCKEIVVENGGDIWMKTIAPITLSIYAGDSPLSEKVGVEVPESYRSLGICTSSATVGHSLSFGRADAVMIACKNAALADAYATSYCNRVMKESDINHLLGQIEQRDDILCAAMIMGKTFGMKGKFRMKLLRN